MTESDVQIKKLRRISVADKLAMSIMNLNYSTKPNQNKATDNGKDNGKDNGGKGYNRK